MQKRMTFATPNFYSSVCNMKNFIYICPNLRRNNMNKETMAVIAKKVEAFATGFVGVCFFSLGTSYFQVRFLYRVPRILEPVFDLFGGVGLAVGLLILGSGLIYWGFTQWKPVSVRKNLYWIIAAVSLAAGIFLANWEFNPNKSEEIRKEMEQKRQNQLEEILHAEKPDLKNAEADKHLSDFEDLYKRYEKSLNDKDEAAATVCENEYTAWRIKTTDIMQALNNDEKAELARYLAKLSIRWGELMQ